MTDLLVIAVCTLLVGGESAYDMEDFGRAREDRLRTFLPLPNCIASHDTSDRLDRGIHRKQLHAALNPAYPRHLLEIGCVGPGSRS